jgi:sarcosine oxidase subunit beta
VTLLEKGSVGAQSSGVNFGNIRLQGRHPSQYPLALRAHALWEQIESLVGESCEFTAKGHLYLALRPEQLPKLEQYAAEARAHDVTVELMTGSEARRHWPWLGLLVAGASWSRRDATANPRLVTLAVARAAKSLGAEILECARAVDIERTGGLFRIKSDRAVAVESPFLVNAAGAWGGEIAARFGEPVPMFTAGPPQLVTEPLPYFIGPAVQAVDGSVIFRQVERGNVIASGFPRGPSDPVRNRAPVAPAKTVAAMHRLAEIVPALGSAHVIRVWSGIEGYLPDMLPVIGWSATTAGLLHAFGFCGHGFQLGPGVANCLAELATAGATETPLDAFSIARFASPVRADAERLGREFDVAVVAESLASQSANSPTLLPDRTRS